MKVLSRLPNSEKLKKKLKLSKEAAQSKKQGDEEIAAILRGDCDRLLLIVGPCSADDPAAVLEYAGRLARVAEAVRQRVCVVLRVFTAKPRSTSAGYMGLVHEADGIRAARRLHLAVREQTGLSTADELLYLATLPYFDDIVSYYTIGARSVENQEHRLMASGLAMPVGMKNPLSGDLQAMANAVAAAKTPHDFIFNGYHWLFSGNPLAHGVLRGGNQPNFGDDSLHILHEMGLCAVIVDANHGNSGKDYARQPEIAMQVLESRRHSDIVRGMVKGLMIESYIVEGAESRGRQAFGQSITDPCLGFGDTEKLIYEIADKI